ncbi:hypothetical protein MTR_6g033565 [Medicago truncatula]|uniref:Uncharacterized protein n=1 Tax=Medicago truncatula TaxID=3880 RepID=A0A072U7M7_MEDTR|nr:hypothetical protein MTR_6g033565 [Medicago truncatula]
MRSLARKSSVDHGYVCGNNDDNGHGNLNCGVVVALMVSPSSDETNGGCVPICAPTPKSVGVQEVQSQA